MNQKHIIYLTDKRSFTNVRELVEWASEQYHDRIAFSYREKASAKESVKISYRQFGEDVRALASAMLAMGCAGRHVALIGKLSYEWVVT